MNRRVLTPVPSASAAPPAAATEAAFEESADILARTLWGEARGESVRGIEAVAAVVLNRVAVARARGGFWWGGSVADVCRKPRQFSCWNEGDPNRVKLLAVGADDPVFNTCRRIARRAVAGLLDDPTAGATHYHVRGIEPRWAVGRSPCAEIGRHLFYREIA